MSHGMEVSSIRIAGIASLGTVPRFVPDLQLLDFALVLDGFK